MWCEPCSRIPPKLHVDAAQHYQLFVLNQELTNEHEAVVYCATTDTTVTYFCPVPGYVGIVGSKAAL